VLFSALLPGERLRGFYLIGVLFTFFGAGVLMTKGQSLSFDSQYGPDYLAAIVCAQTWSGYLSLIILDDESS